VGGHTAVGRTPKVTGSLTLAGSTVTAASITADLTVLVSDSAQRDDQLRRQAIQTDTFPTATFTLTQPIALGSLPADGVTVSAKRNRQPHDPRRDKERPDPDPGGTAKAASSPSPARSRSSSATTASRDPAPSRSCRSTITGSWSCTCSSPTSDERRLAASAARSWAADRARSGGGSRRQPVPRRHSGRTRQPCTAGSSPLFRKGEP
jgi:hypothetical protein